MRKLLFVLMLVSCEKEPEERFCFDCRRDIYNDVGYYSVMLEACDQTEVDIIAFEKENTYIKGTITASMKCWRKGDVPEI